MIEENLAPRDSNTGMKLYLPSPIATANNELCEYDRTRISLKLENRLIEEKRRGNYH